MEKITDIKLIESFTGEEDLKEFNKFLKAFGIDSSLEDTTLKHTRERLEVLVALAEEGKDPKIAAKKAELKKLLENLKGTKEEKAEMKAIKEVYRSENFGNKMELKELDRKIKHAMKEVKKYEHFKKHEEKIAERWIKELSK